MVKSVGLCPGYWVSLCAMNSMILCVCVNFLCCDFLDYVSLNITVTIVNFPPKMPIIFAP